MKVLSIGTDRKLFEEGSAVHERSLDYASKMEELHIIVFSLKQLGLQEKIVGNLHIYPTNSSSKTGYIFDAIKIGKKIIKKNGFVVTTQDPFETGLVGYLLKRKLKLPLQIQIHTDFLSPYFKNSFLNRIRVMLAKFIIPKADGLRVVSSVISDSIKKTFPNLKAKVGTLPIFVDAEGVLRDKAESEIDFSPFNFVILMASRLEPEKRIDIALSVFHKVLTQFPDTGLVIVGDGSAKNNLENFTKELGISKNVRFVGWKDNVPLYYLKSDIFLMTSDFEGYGMTLLQAGSFGCAIVTTKVGIAKTDLFKNGENSFVCPVGDVDCLADSIINLITDEEKRKLFKDRMQASIKSTAISRGEYVSKYVALLEGLL